MVFTGAGVSTESGIPDFRSPGGVWSRRKPILFDEYLRDPEAQLEYWQQRAETHVQFAAAEPNVAHRTFASLGKNGADSRRDHAKHRRIAPIGRQSQRARTARNGPPGRLPRMCRPVRRRRDVAAISRSRKPFPVVPECGGLTKHATISFGQSLSPEVLQSAIGWAREADLFLAIGSSLVVTPAAELPALAKSRGLGS